MLVVTGGPGVGKTTIVRAILAVLARAKVDVRLAAPTGRAAKRMSEATGAEATTLHRLLEFEPKTMSFKRNRSHPIEGGAIVVDEASMLDLPMADALTQAIAPGTRLILVGDVDQLPSVGPGAVLRDVIASGAVPSRPPAADLPPGRAQPHRHERPPHQRRASPRSPRRRAPTPTSSSSSGAIPRRPATRILELVTSRIPHRFGLDPVRDVQVLTPMNRGPAGAIALNEALQAALNPRGDALVRGARTYRVGDKVMQLRNDYDRNVFNGDVGFVTSIDPEESAMVVRFDDREVAFEASDLDELVARLRLHRPQVPGQRVPRRRRPAPHHALRHALEEPALHGRDPRQAPRRPRLRSRARSSSRSPQRRREDRRTRLAARLGGDRRMSRSSLTSVRGMATL